MQMRSVVGRKSAEGWRLIRRLPHDGMSTLDRACEAPYSTISRVRDRTVAMVAKTADRFGLAELASDILIPLRKMRNVSPPEMAKRMGLSPRAYNDFENGRTKLLVERVMLFAEILRLDHVAILTAFHYRKPRIAHVFAHNKFMLVQTSAVDELDDETQDAVAAVDPLTTLDAHLQFYAQLAEHGRAQIRTADGRRS